MQVIAEYVETRALADLLRDFGVDYLQGNYTGLASKDIDDRGMMIDSPRRTFQCS